MLWPQTTTRPDRTTMNLSLLFLLVAVAGALSQSTGKPGEATTTATSTQPKAAPDAPSNPWNPAQLRSMLEKMWTYMSGVTPLNPPNKLKSIPKPPATLPAGNSASASSAQAPTKGTTSKPTTKPPAPKDCFWEGKKYRPGSDIIRGQYDTWCYVTYCDLQGKIQFWDDYNCPPNSMAPTSEHNTGNGRGMDAAGLGVPARPGKPGSGSGAGVAGAGADAGPVSGAGGGRRGGNNKAGCFHKGVQYSAGQEISNHKVGQRCYGTYCDFNSKVVNWEDWCLNTPPSSGGAETTTSGTPQDGCWHKGQFFATGQDVISGQIGDQCYGYYCDGQNTFVHWEDMCAPATPAPTATTAGTGFFWK